MNQSKKDPNSSLNSRKSPRAKIFSLPTILAILALLLILVPAIIKKASDSKIEPSGDILSGSQAIQDKNTATFKEGSSSIEAVVKQVSPSVVSITTTEEVDSFFGRQVSSGAGTGIILSKDGYVLTNRHVVGKNKSIVIVAHDGTQYDSVRLVASDPLNDLAFLKIDGVSDLSPAEIGNSQTVKVGQPVLAIGNALGLYQNSVTSGIISGASRSVTAYSGTSLGSQAEVLSDMIQTDAAINSGNSGGPLVNAGGQVIGVNTAVTRGANGIGFAIPIGAAKGLIKQLGKTDKVERGYLGVNYLPVTPEIAKKYDLKVKQGAYIPEDKNVLVDSPAAKAGMKRGDVITKINDDVIGEMGGLGTLISEYAPGEKVLVSLLRDGKVKVVEVELAAYRE